MNLADKRAVVTGGGLGIGRAISCALARAGADVAVLDISASDAETTCRTVREAGRQAVALVGSVADAGSVRQCFAQLDEVWERVDILINNAGVSGNCPALDLSDDDWQRIIGVNLSGVFYCSREAARRMREKQGGCIVNIGSINSVAAFPNRVSYCSSKAAVAMMTKTLAVEWAQYGIRVNCVGPGYVDTPFLRELAASGRVDYDALIKRTPQHRFATPEEIADAVLYFCNPRSASITGQVLCVDGGWTAYGYI